MGATITNAPQKPLHCSFCARSQEEVGKLVAGPAVFICDSCVAACADIVADKPGAIEKTRKLGAPETWPTERHLRLLEAREQLAEMARASLQSSIDILRGRGVSWETIGKAMGCSRQAAWERFG